MLAWPISRERKIPKTSTLLRRLPTSRAITRTRFEFKRSKVNVTMSINAETESVSSMNFKLGRWLEHVVSTAMASYKGLVKLGYSLGGGIPCSRTRDGHTTCLILICWLTLLAYVCNRSWSCFNTVAPFPNRMRGNVLCRYA